MSEDYALEGRYRTGGTLFQWVYDDSRGYLPDSRVQHAADWLNDNAITAEIGDVPMIDPRILDIAHLNYSPVFDADERPNGGWTL